MCKKVVCWGIGQRALEAVQQISKLYDIEYLVDKRVVSEETWDEYCVYQPSKIMNDIANIDYIFITTWVYCLNVYKQCVNMGIDKRKIKYWDIVTGHSIEIDELYGNMIHSGNGEEIYLKNIFGNKEKGTYVDVGAFHPLRVSNTLWAYKRGWRGINIEPNADNMEYFDLLRPEDKNINCGISDKDGEMIYYQLDDGAYNTFNYQLLVQDKLTDRIVKTKKVPVRKLKDILKENNINTVDFLDIDVEGYEMSVLSGIDFTVDIKIILLEQLYMSLPDVLNSEAYCFLKAKGYEAVAKFGETVIYKKV